MNARLKTWLILRKGTGKKMGQGVRALAYEGARAKNNIGCLHNYGCPNYFFYVRLFSLV
jgi:hypothetical protein